MTSSEFIDFQCDSGASLYANGSVFHLKGLNYFGMETDIRVPHGLWGSTSLDKIMRFMKTHRFNAMRVPLATQAVIEDSAVDSSKVRSEPACANETLTYLQILDHLICTCEQENILVVLDCHVVTSEIPDNWTVFAAQVDTMWQKLTHRYARMWNVIGADLCNEPHGPASWGTGTRETDWNLLAQDLATRIHGICPRWLILVQGVSANVYGVADIRPSFWGGNLQGVHSHPIRLADPSKLVYSPHCYGPSVFEQSYFQDRDFPANMESIWQEQFGNVPDWTGNALLVGEWGGKYETTPDRQWQDAFVTYLKHHNISSFYWCLNPNSIDTRGLLLDDWTSPDTAKLEMLSVLNSTPIHDSPSRSRIISSFT